MKRLSQIVSGPISQLLAIVLLSSAGMQAQEVLSLDEPLQARAMDIGIMLEWQDSNNWDVSSYIVEKSRDGLSFEAIGETEISKENETYRYLDVLARSNPIYYRIGVYEHDGTAFLSEIVRLDQTPPNNFIISHISTVRSSTTFTVNFESFMEGELEYTVRDWNGIIEQSGHIIVVTGNNELTIDLTESDPSIYKLHLNMLEEEEVLTFERVVDEKTQTASDR